MLKPVRLNLALSVIWHVMFVIYASCGEPGGLIFCVTRMPINMVLERSGVWHDFAINVVYEGPVRCSTLEELDTRTKYVPFSFLTSYMMKLWA